MEDRYLVPLKFGQDEFTEKKSRFIGRVWRISSEEEAMEHLTEIRTSEKDARHNVWAYMLHSGAVRCSDDGEPQGTGGIPVLDSFRKRGIFDFCCVVTRYFGGILLGAGGLVRAYSKAAALAMDSAGTAQMRPVARLQVECLYSQYEKILKELSLAGCCDPSVEWLDKVRVMTKLPEENSQELIARISDLTAGSVIPQILSTEFDAL